MLRSGLRAGQSPEPSRSRISRLAEAAGIDQQDIVDQHAFLVDDAAVGRHRSRRDPADIGMVAARRDKPGGRGIAVDEHRHDHGDVGQMGAAAIGRVEHIDVARLHAAPVARPLAAPRAR